MCVAGALRKKFLRSVRRAARNAFVNCGMRAAAVFENVFFRTVAVLAQKHLFAGAGSSWWSWGLALVTWIIFKTSLIHERGPSYWDGYCRNCSYHDPPRPVEGRLEWAVALPDCPDDLCGLGTGFRNASWIAVQDARGSSGQHASSLMTTCVHSH